MNRRLTSIGASICLAVAIGGSPNGHAATTTFSGTGNWNDVARWAPSLPASGDDVVIDGAVTLTNTTVVLASYTLAATRSHMFMGSNTILRATNVVITGTMTHSENTATSAPWAADHVIRIEAFTNLHITAAGLIDVDSKGFAGGLISSNGSGPGGGIRHGTNDSAGGGYGGRGGKLLLGPPSMGLLKPGGVAYGSAASPSEPGSGGGANSSSDTRDGGGLVIIQATSATVRVDGSITASGGNSTLHASGGGSGGGVNIACETFAGSGSITADGGNGSCGGRGSGGGGGRIAVTYSNAQSVTVTFSAAGGVGADCNVPTALDGEVGTIYLSNSDFFPSGVIASRGRIVIPGFTNWAPNSLTITNGGIIQFPDMFIFNVTGDVVIANGGGLDIRNHSTLNVGGDLILTNASSLYVYAGPTNIVLTNYGALVSLGGDLRVYSNATVRPIADGTNGGTVLFQMDSLFVALGGTINADYAGFESAGTEGVGRGYGAGGSGQGGNYGGGGGFGGAGGDATNVGIFAAGGVAYGSSNAPVGPGSSGGNSGSGAGGGSVRLVGSIFGDMHVDGLITADGGDSLGHGDGPGSGGAVYIYGGTFTGSGAVSADGADAPIAGGGPKGGGGGGRIAIARASNAWTGVTLDTNLVSGGIGRGNYGHDGEFGTIVEIQLILPPPAGTMIWVR